MTSIGTRRQLSVTMLGAALALVVWLPLLTTYVAAPYAWTTLWWIHLDVAELIALGGAGLLAWRRHPAATVFAAAAATLLVADAVTDVALATVDAVGPTELVRALAMALLAELPLALLCLDLARQSARCYPEPRTLLAARGVSRLG